ncbi:regulator of G protein signaling domain-containing protein [Ditylenchus destructor]|uniref:Regulator of G protein signaling domain-containing protein n=1 Tax=Ditylenchus destructor TaxID=166010 RepID=A0AAD4N1R8_9BILA|nr:regulator of G protein signaling domain-containing protein [Ditylenchus destructor]
MNVCFCIYLSPVGLDAAEPLLFKQLPAHYMPNQLNRGFLKSQHNSRRSPLLFQCCRTSATDGVEKAQKNPMSFETARVCVCEVLRLESQFARVELRLGYWTINCVPRLVVVRVYEEYSAASPMANATQLLKEKGSFDEPTLAGAQQFFIIVVFFSSGLNRERRSSAVDRRRSCRPFPIISRLPTPSSLALLMSIIIIWVFIAVGYEYRQQRDKLHSAKSPRTFPKKDANDLSNLSCNSRRRVDRLSIVGSHFPFAPTKRPKDKKEDIKEKVSLTSENSDRAPSPEVKKSTKKRKVTAALLAGAAQQRFLQIRRRSVARQPRSPSQYKTSSNIDSTDFPHKEGKSAANAPFCTFNEEEVSELLSSRQSQNQECASGPLHQFATVSSHGVLVQTSDEGEKKGSRKSKRGNRHFSKDTSPSSSTDCVVSKKSVDKENRNPDIINSSPQHTKVATEPHMPGNSGGGGGGTVIDKTDIEQVLKSEIARAPFQQFLQQQFCSENINFYLAVEEYRAIPESEVERRADFGRLIFERHFASNCIEPVNIDNSTANSIRTAYKENKFSGDLYDVVQYQIFHLLKYDCWPRYLRAGIQGSEDYGGDGSSRGHADSIASTSARGQNFTTYEVSTLRERNVESSENAQRSNEIENLIRPYSQTSTSYSSDESNIDFTDSGCNTSSSVDEPKYYTETGSKSTREPPSDFPLKTCTLLRADVATEITLFDQLQSVKQWAVATAEAHGLDKSATEVVDAQTGSTIDPARQAVDALNNRTVRIMPVVKFPVVFLASSTAAKPSPPIPAKVVILRARTALTVGKTIRPMMAKYNVDPEQAVVCVSGTCEIIKLPTPVSQIYQKSLTVMSEQQFAERKLLPKREYQKELALVPTWMTASNPDQGLPFHQHGDVGFCEISIEAEGKGLKHNATRSYSSSREFFKFGRKPSQAKSGRLDHDPSGGGSPSEFGAHLRNPLLNRGSDRRKSVGSTASPNASSATQKPTTSGAASQHRPSGPSDIPYCGENEPEPVITSDVLTPYTTVSSAKHEVLYPTKSAISSSASSFSSSSSFTTARQSLCCEIPDFLKKTDIPNSSSSMTAQTSGANGSMPCIPPLFTSTVRSDKDSAMTPTEVIESGLAWQKADYV